MLSKETVALCRENHTKYTNTLCGQNAEFQYVKADDTYRTTGLETVKRGLNSGNA
jgi:hypothetical protein